MNKKTISVSGL